MILYPFVFSVFLVCHCVDLGPNGALGAIMTLEQLDFPALYRGVSV